MLHVDRDISVSDVRGERLVALCRNQLQGRDVSSIGMSFSWPRAGDQRKLVPRCLWCHRRYRDHVWALHVHVVGALTCAFILKPRTKFGRKPSHSRVADMCWNLEGSRQTSADVLEFGEKSRHIYVILCWISYRKLRCIVSKVRHVVWKVSMYRIESFDIISKVSIPVFFMLMLQEKLKRIEYRNVSIWLSGSYRFDVSFMGKIWKSILVRYLPKKEIVSTWCFVSPYRIVLNSIIVRYPSKLYRLDFQYIDIGSKSLSRFDIHIINSHCCSIP